jgi:hypothetical protein
LLEVVQGGLDRSKVSVCHQRIIPAWLRGRSRTLAEGRRRASVERVSGQRETVYVELLSEGVQKDWMHWNRRLQNVIRAYVFRDGEDEGVSVFERRRP